MMLSIPSALVLHCVKYRSTTRVHSYITTSFSSSRAHRNRPRLPETLRQGREAVPMTVEKPTSYAQDRKAGTNQMGCLAGTVNIAHRNCSCKEGMRCHFRRCIDAVEELCSFIARRLTLSPKTVSNHISNILSKLQVVDRAQAVSKAWQAGLDGR